MSDGCRKCSYERRVIRHAVTVNERAVAAGQPADLTVIEKAKRRIALCAAAGHPARAGAKAATNTSP